MRLHKVLAVLVLSMLAGAGCATASLSQVKQFGAATTSLGANTRKAFDLASAASTDRQIYSVASNPKESPKDADFVGLFGQGPIADTLKLRLRVLDQLTSYSAALQQLAAADVGAEIDSAAKDLNGSLVGLRDTFKKATSKDLAITDAGIGIVSTAIDAIGKAVVEKKRRSALKETITMADPAVQQVTSLIAHDFGPATDLAIFVKQTIINTRGSVLVAYNLERSRATFEARLVLLDRMRQLYEAESTVEPMFGAIGKGATAAGKAHAALKSAVDNKDFSSEEAAVWIGELTTYAKSINEFYKSLEK
jgi:hypothetical protein